MSTDPPDEEKTNRTTQASDPDPTERASELIGTETLWSGQLLYTGAQLGLFEALGEEPMPVEELAERLDTHPDTTYRVLRALAHFEVIEEHEGRRFSVTPVAKRFRADHPESVRHALLVDRSPEWVRPMLHLPDVVREGGPSGFEREFGAPFFEYLGNHPDFAETFNDHMTALTREDAEAVLDALSGYDLDRFDHVCDVAGGHGRLCCRLLEAYPHLRGTVFDQPAVVEERAGHWASELGVADRCTYVGGDMFEAVPEADAYFLKSILHDWGDDDCRRILETLRETITAEGRLFVVELVIPGPGEPHPGKRLDMTMLIHAGGRERTRAEYAALFEATGWTLEGVHEPEESAFSVLEAAPV